MGQDSGAPEKVTVRLRRRKRKSPGTRMQLRDENGNPTGKVVPRRGAAPGTVGRPPKWSPTYTSVMRLTGLIAGGMELSQALDTVGCTRNRYLHLRRSRPEFARVIREAQKRKKEVNRSELAAPVLGALPKKVARLWRELHGPVQRRGAAGLKDRRRIAAKEMRLALREGGDRLRMRVFLYSCVRLMWDTNAALAAAGCTKADVDRWLADQEFCDLAAEIRWRQENFVESQLMKLVADGDRGAVIFASKTLNAKRGFGETKKVSHTHTGEVRSAHAHALVDASKLPVEIQRQIVLHARGQGALPPAGAPEEDDK